eukprot:9451855-Alexandrium_andersonii.AAC.1
MSRVGSSCAWWTAFARSWASSRSGRGRRLCRAPSRTTSSPGLASASPTPTSCGASTVRRRTSTSSSGAAVCTTWRRT